MTDLVSSPHYEEEIYQRTLTELRSPSSTAGTSTLFVVLLLVFAVGAFADIRSVSSVVLLVVAIVVHEAGHAMGMRAFRFRDVRMFFIPFFGAAVTGRPRGAASWKEAIVSLLGPLPGVFAGLTLLIFAAGRPQPTALLFHAAEMLLWLNAFNLLPFGFLDGGRFLERVLFSRHRVLELAFQLFGYGLLGLVAFKGSMYMLGAFAVLALFGLPARWRTLTAAASLRRQHPGLHPNPDQLGDADGRAVFAAAQATLTFPAREQPAALARTMESLLDATKRAPGALASLGLLSLYGMGLVCAFSAVVLLSFHLGPVKWQYYTEEDWRAEFPRKPHDVSNAEETGLRAVVDATERFTIVVREGAGDNWMDVAIQRLAQESQLTLAGSKPIQVSGYHGRELELRTPERVMRARMVATANRRYQVVTSAPRWGENQRRFLESFAILSNEP